MDRGTGRVAGPKKVIGIHTCDIHIRVPGGFCLPVSNTSHKSGAIRQLEVALGPVRFLVHWIISGIHRVWQGFCNPHRLACRLMVGRGRG